MYSENLKDTNGIIRSRKSNEKLHNSKKKKTKKDKIPKNYLQNTTEKTNDCTTREPLSIRGANSGTLEDKQFLFQ